MVNLKYRFLSVVLGVSLIITAGTIAFLGGSVKKDSATTDVLQKILIFTRTLPAGHTLSAADLKWVATTLPTPAGALIGGQKSELEIVGITLNRPVALGEPVSEAVLNPKIGAASLAGRLNPGFRAVTISVDATQLVSGRMLPSDRVDIVLTPGDGQASSPIPIIQSSDPFRTKVIKVLDNVRILAIGGATEPAKPETGQMDASILSGSNVTLELRPDQAERVLASLALGKIALLLRRPNDFDTGGLSGQSPNLRVRPGQVPIPMTAPGQQAPSLLPGSGTGLGGQPQPTEPSVVIVRGSN
jgi:Flp pilus assembly protein CpaB